eukprot:TRINITY_DN16458_c0_g1_i1.p2 TRINITY_DN16458_c0_g1~~TRINITY_DN16458_c0_g1_i1.p2  ORF type:complete len:107 (-),score=13.80 TRINITY_DN16458_c0_g1_i1:76-396(-)
MPHPPNKLCAPIIHGMNAGENMKWYVLIVPQMINKMPVASATRRFSRRRNDSATRLMRKQKRTPAACHMHRGQVVERLPVPEEQAQQDGLLGQPDLDADDAQSRRE